MLVSNIPLQTHPNLERIADSTFAELYCIPNLLSSEQCETIIEESRCSMARSRVGAEHDKTTVDLKVRSSFSSMLSVESTHPTVLHIHDLLFSLYGHRNLNSDPMQVHRYGPGQHFSEHFDYHDPVTRAERIAREGQRTWTMIVYLNDDFEGGETNFPNLGLKLKPESGMLVAWNNLLPTGEGNEYTLHESLPIISGEKNIISKWFRDKVIS